MRKYMQPYPMSSIAELHRERYPSQNFDNLPSIIAARLPLRRPIQLIARVHIKRLSNIAPL